MQYNTTDSIVSHRRFPPCHTEQAAYSRRDAEYERLEEKELFRVEKGCVVHRSKKRQDACWNTRKENCDCRDIYVARCRSLLVVSKEYWQSLGYQWSVWNANTILMTTLHLSPNFCSSSATCIMCSSIKGKNSMCMYSIHSARSAFWRPSKATRGFCFGYKSWIEAIYSHLSFRGRSVCSEY